MSEIRFYVNTYTNINEGLECNIYFRKNDELENLNQVLSHYYNEEEEYPTISCFTPFQTYSNFDTL